MNSTYNFKVLALIALCIKSFNVGAKIQELNFDLSTKNRIELIEKTLVNAGYTINSLNSKSTNYISKATVLDLVNMSKHWQACFVSVAILKAVFNFNNKTKINNIINLGFNKSELEKHLYYSFELKNNISTFYKIKNKVTDFILNNKIKLMFVSGASTLLGTIYVYNLVNKKPNKIDLLKNANKNAQQSLIHPEVLPATINAIPIAPAFNLGKKVTIKKEAKLPSTKENKKLESSGYPSIDISLTSNNTDAIPVAPPLNIEKKSSIKTESKPTIPNKKNIEIKKPASSELVSALGQLKKTVIKDTKETRSQGGLVFNTKLLDMILPNQNISEESSSEDISDDEWNTGKIEIEDIPTISKPLESSININSEPHNNSISLASNNLDNSDLDKIVRRRSAMLGVLPNDDDNDGWESDSE